MVDRSYRRRPSCRMACQSPSLPPMPNGGCSSALARLRAVDFAIADTVLYLDAYPECPEALSYYHQLLTEREALSSELAGACRMPMTNLQNVSRDSWDWTHGPWPWDADAN